MTTATTDPIARVTLLTAADVARALRVSVRSVWTQSSLAEAGLAAFPKPVRLGGRMTRWRLRDIEAYLDGLGGQNDSAENGS